MITHRTPLTDPVSADVDPRIIRSRERIVTAAIELIAESGARAFTVEAVADRSGVAKSTLYRHWPSIEALLVDVLRTAMPQQPVVPDPAATFEVRLRQQVAMMIATLSDPDWSRVLPELLALRHQFPELEGFAEADRCDKEANLDEILAVGVSEGRLPAGLDARTVATTLFGPIILCAVFGEVDRLETVAAYTVERFLAGYPPNQ